MSKFVQHISGQGEKFELRACAWNDFDHETWLTVSTYDSIPRLELPRSEYRLVAHSEQWEDVTAEFKMFVCSDSLVLGKSERFKYIDGVHNGPAFIVERRKS